MLPTMTASGEWVIEESFSVRLFPRPFQRGELVTFIAPYDATRQVCKRVLGLPGDVVCVDPTGERAPSTEHVVVPQGHLWLIGDNAPGSVDSRNYGPVPMGLIVGRVRGRVRSKSLFLLGLADREPLVLSVEDCQMVPSRMHCAWGGVVVPGYETSDSEACTEVSRTTSTWSCRLMLAKSDANHSIVMPYVCTMVYIDRNVQ